MARTGRDASRAEVTRLKSTLEAPLTNDQSVRFSDLPSIAHEQHRVISASGERSLMWGGAPSNAYPLPSGLQVCTMQYGIVLDIPDGWYRHRCSSDYWSSRVVVSGDAHLSPACGRDDCHVACGDY